MEQPCRKQGDDDGRRKEVPDHLPEAVGGDQQIVDAVQHHADPQNPHRAGAGEPRTAEHIGQCQTGQDAADQMQGPGGHAADEQENKTSCTVFGQVADVFKGSKAHCNANGRRSQLVGIRLKDQEVEQQRQQLQDLFADRCDLYGGGHGTALVPPHEKAADISRKQAGGHAQHHEQGKAPGAARCEQQGEQHGKRQAQKDVFNAGAEVFTS